MKDTEEKVATEEIVSRETMDNDLVPEMGQEKDNENVGNADDVKQTELQVEGQDASADAPIPSTGVPVLGTDAPTAGADALKPPEASTESELPEHTFLREEPSELIDKIFKGASSVFSKEQRAQLVEKHKKYYRENSAVETGEGTETSGDGKKKTAKRVNQGETKAGEVDQPKGVHFGVT